MASFDHSVLENFDVSELFSFSNEEEGDENAEPTSSFFANQLKATTFVLDCSRVPEQQLPLSLFTSSDNNTSAWETALRGIITYMRHRIQASRSDKVAFVLFGVRSENDEEAIPGIRTVVNLELLGARSVKQVQKLLPLKSSEFVAEFALTDEEKTPLYSELLWFLQRLYTRKVNEERYTQQVFVIAPHDDPPMEAADRRAALQRAKDCAAERIIIEVIPLPPLKTQNFNALLFFADLMGIDKSGAEEELKDYKLTLDAFLPAIRRKEHAERTRGSMPFQLFEGLTIGLSMYSNFQEARKPLPTILHAASKEPLKTQSRYLDAQTGNIVAPPQLTKFLPLNDGEKIAFQSKELFEVTDGGEPGLMLLGFRSRSELKWHHSMKSSAFFYPETKKGIHAVEGGDELFAAFLAAMKETDKIAICKFVPRRNVMPRLVALLPQFEVQDEFGLQLRPPGLHLLTLPFADDLRSLDLTDHVADPSDNSSRREVIVGKLLKKIEIATFDPESLPNPSLQTFNAGIEAVALDLTKPEPITDVTILSDSIIREIAPYANEWADELLSAGGSLSVARAVARPKASPAPQATAAERQEKVDELKVLIEGGRLGGLVVPALKAYLAALGLPVSGRKSDLTDRLTQYAQQH